MTPWAAVLGWACRSSRRACCEIVRRRALGSAAAKRAGLYSSLTVGRGAVARQGQRKGDFLAGKYLLEDCLGIGGMGEVYRATNVSLGRKVAIKLLSPEFVHIEEDVLRFLREARAAAAVRHANVVDVLDVARDDDGTPFIVQELLAGEDLERYLTTRDGRLGWEEALEIMIPVADAVAAAHAQDVVHRDLKPANIFLARDRNKITPKVLDFGACLFPTIAERSAKEVRMLIGTPHYMAPEQIVSKQDVDARSDVWALGVIFYEMIVGETPFEAATANAVLQLVKTRDVPPLRDRARAAPAELEALVARCTRRDRLARYPHAGAVHEALLDLRPRQRGARVSSRMETLTELPAQRPPELPVQPDEVVRPRHVPSLDQPAPPRAPAPRRGGLLTLSSPGSEPPPSFDAFDLDIPLPPSVDGPRRVSHDPSALAPSPPASAELPIPAAPAAIPIRSHLEPSGMRQLDPDESGPTASLDLAARPSSWPPASMRGGAAPRSSPPSSLPPVLDPRALGAMPSSIPPVLLPREAREESAPPAAPEIASGPAAQGQPRPPAVIAKEFTSSSRNAAWSTVEMLKLLAVVGVPAVVAFGAVLSVPALGTPIGRALRGDSTLASGVMAVVALASAAALSARSILGERNRWLYAAAAGAVLFGIVMIIVTFAASEASALGVPHSMGGLSTAVAPLAPLALGLGAVARARAAWVDPYARGEALRFAALASLMLFLMLALGPVGAVRTPPRP
ncbi:MAG: serine/threonine protein kinase, partial [Labilithrix sp.]|nr:serine/threonine protein kinase [Labilithrix sp.]